MRFIFIIILLVSHCYADRYQYNRQVPLELWNHLSPHFLPTDHPAKPMLDKLFKNNITQSKETFEAAGFKPIKEREPTNIVIGRHPLLPGYILKLYLDTQPPLVEWINWISRISGVNLIRNSIKSKKFTNFTVPKKWIYPLPEYKTYGIHPKFFILVVEDMKILKGVHNQKAYREKITYEMLDQLYFLLSENGLVDSVYIDNIPFNKAGKICFIDTEHYHKWPIKFEKLLNFLSPKMQNYWNELIKKNN